ncbi:hypothetical protein [Streptomyces sp. NPDC005476]|uniref:hypothetical protein n=1 Tax=Streptomyces sp. NPDC005476 TaxID=3156882 RepID=UPI0034519FC9
MPGRSKVGALTGPGELVQLGRHTAGVKEFLEGARLGDTTAVEDDDAVGDAGVVQGFSRCGVTSYRSLSLGRPPELTRLPAFLTAGPTSSSGTMILEYMANSALARVRSCAVPASAGAYRTVLACELVVAVWALRMHPAPPPARAFAVAAAALPSGADDRPLTADVSTAAELLEEFARL